MLTVNGLDELRDLAGTTLGPGDWWDITQERVDRFADATGDHQWIHVDAERARTGPFGGTIAHGYLTVSLLGLDRAVRGGRVRDGDNVLLLSAGTGYTWAATVVRWGPA